MVAYQLDSTVPSPGEFISFLEFSPSGRFLAVGDRVSSVLCILDRLTGFCPTISAVTFAKPTALVWETSETFYVGLSDGRFTHYQIVLGGKKLVQGVTDTRFYGQFPIAAIALNVDLKTLALSVGPDILVLRRTRATSGFRFVTKLSNFNFERDPGIPAPSFPRSFCFTSKNMLVISFCRRNIAFVVLEFDGESLISSSSQTARIDTLPLSKEITSTSGDEIHRAERLWLRGGASPAGSDDIPFLFINEGTATLSSSALGGAIIRSATTQHEVQFLEHPCICRLCVSLALPCGRLAVTNCHSFVLAYHVSNDKYNIATVNHGVGATIKIWASRRSSRAQGQWCTIIPLLVALLVMLGAVEKPLNVAGITQSCFRTILTFIKICIKVGYFILGVIEDGVPETGDTLG